MVLAAFVYFMLFQTYGHVAFSALTLLVGTIRYDTIRDAIPTCARKPT